MLKIPKTSYSISRSGCLIIVINFVFTEFFITHFLNEKIFNKIYESIKLALSSILNYKDIRERKISLMNI